MVNERTILGLILLSLVFLLATRNSSAQQGVAEPTLDVLKTFSLGKERSGLPPGNVEKLQPIETPAPLLEGELDWYDAAAWETEGQAFSDLGRRFARLPKKAENKVAPFLWRNAQHSTGLVVRFRTDASSIHVRYELCHERLEIVHMPATGVSGVDLYVHDGRSWRWGGNNYPFTQSVPETVLVSNMRKQVRDCMLYLPLYNGIDRLHIGVPHGSFFTAIAPLHSKSLPEEKRQKPFLYYGTSIAQGAGANRPGLAFTSLLARELDVPAWNMGFDASGTMDTQVAEFFAELDPSAYFIDCLPNMNAEMIEARTPEFVRILKKARPETPVVLVEDRTFDNAWLRENIVAHHQTSRKALWTAYQTLQAEGFDKLYYLPAEGMLGSDSEGAADGSHPNDLGMFRMKEAILPVLRKIDNKKNGED